MNESVNLLSVTTDIFVLAWNTFYYWKDEPSSKTKKTPPKKKTTTSESMN